MNTAYWFLRISAGFILWGSLSRTGIAGAGNDFKGDGKSNILLSNAVMGDRVI
ncbi:MAG: hypothetical protein ABI273_10870 [Lacunisphaera sp.]